MKKKAVIFDATGLLYYRNKDHFNPLMVMLEKQGLKLKDPKIVYDVINRYAKLGLITRRELVDYYLKVLNLYNPKFADRYYKTYERLKSWINIFPNVKRGLKELYNMGLKLYVFSDSSTTSLEKIKWFKKLRISKYFDKIICSCDVGYLKSDIKKLPKFLRMINVKKGNAVFVYHELDDVVSAKLLGITCVSITKNILEDYYIKDLSKLPPLIKELNGD